MSAFTSEELAYLEARKDASRVSEILWVYSVPIVAGTLSTAFRLWAKRVGRNGITLDDYLIVFATICLLGECASGLAYGPPHGLGRHIIVVSPEDMTMVRQGDYVFSHFYDIALASVKLSILAFYYRVFVVPLFRRFVVATAAFVVAWGFGITITLALACRPIEAFWDSNVKGTCLRLVEFTYFTNISNLVTDTWIFLMPIPVIWALQLQTKKKLLLCFIFSIGLATCIVSAIRLTVVLGHTSPDFTWTFVSLGAYSAFEPLGGILCTNLPIIWHMWRKRRPLLPGPSAFKSHPTSTATPGSGDSRRTRIARSLGLSTTANDSQARTMLREEEVTDWPAPEMIMNVDCAVTEPERAKRWNKVEKLDNVQNREEEVEEAGRASDSGIKRQSWPEGQSGKINGPRSPQGLRKNVWEIRKK